MKKSPIFLLFCFPIFLTAQAMPDSLSTSRKVDSLIQVSRTLSGKGDLDKALETNAAAEQMTLEKFGRQSVEYANCSFNRGRLLRSKGDFPKAEACYLEAKSIREKVLGREHPDYARGLNNLANLYLAMGKFEKVEPLHLETIAIWEKLRGKEDPDYAMSLNNLANFYRETGSYEKSEQFHLEAIAIRERLLGKEHPDYAQSLNNMGNLYRDLGNYEKSEQCHLEAKAIRAKKLGKQHPDYGWSLNNLGNLYMTISEYEKAEPLYLEAAVIKEKALGKAHPDYAASLTNLATCYLNKGEYEKAESLYEQAKAIQEKTLGREHPNYIATLVNLATLHKDLGHFEKAEPLYLEAKAISEKKIGKEHPDFATSLTNLALLYSEMGNFDQAESLFKEAIAIQKKALGEEHPEYGRSLNHLAGVYWKMKRYEKAEPLFLEAVTIQEKTLGKEHREYGTSLNNLANLYADVPNFEKAESLYLQAKAIQEKTLGKEHLEYAACLTNLAQLYTQMNHLEKVGPLLLEAKTLVEKFHGNEHPYRTPILNNLANHYAETNDHEKADQLYAELAAVNQIQLTKAVRHLSERELNDYLDQFLQSQYNSLVFATRHNVKKSASTNFDNCLFYKGFLLHAAARIKRFALADSTTTEKFNLLKSYERRLSQQYALPLAERGNAKIVELETRANDLEKDLARTVAGFGQATRQVKWQEVQAALRPGEATVEFVHYTVLGKRRTDSLMYAALVLLPNSQPPAFIPLFEEKQLDSLLKTSGERKLDYVNALYTFAGRGARPLSKPKKTLYELLWQPLEKHLDGAKTVYFSPSGLLHRLNFAAIPTDEEQTLADRFNLVQLKSTRQLVISEQTQTPLSRGQGVAVLFGGINFNPDTTASASTTADLTARSRGSDFSFENTDSTLRATYPIFSKEKSATGKKGKGKKSKLASRRLSRDLGSEAWDYLPGTEKEIDAVEKLMSSAGISVQSNRGSGATEEVFKKIGQQPIDGVTRSHPVNHSPRILHLATHGYFFPDPSVNRQPSTVNRDEPVFKISDHPMLRSGLILAGGNAAWQGAKTLEGREDGILTAYEISQMNLSNTELVVLSACETGLGDISGNEGVYGLQRAFKIAGAKYLIMSLWQVPDKQTTELMKAFYQKWLVEKLPVPEAFRAAQQAMRERFVDPYAWAGFVLIE